MTASPCKASRIKFLANEREQVWISMSAPIKKRRKKINKQVQDVMYKNDDNSLQKSLVKKYVLVDQNECSLHAQQC